MTEQLDIELSVNGEKWCVRPQTTVAELLSELGLQKRGLAVEINQAVLPSDDFEKRTLNDGDSLEIVTLVGGG
jgi:sulfur carrier protein